jgi:EpsI family protein
MKIRIVLLCLVLLAASAFIASASRPEAAPVGEPLSGLPMRVGDWEGEPAADLDSKVIAVLGVDAYVNREYKKPESVPVGLYIGYYQSQREGDTIHSPLNCLPGAGWNPIKRGHISIPTDKNSAIEINRIIIQNGMNNKGVVLYWYQSHGRVVASEYWAKIYTVLDALRTNRTDAALVRVICPVAGTSQQAEAFAERRAVEFVSALYPLLFRFIPA